MADDKNDQPFGGQIPGAANGKDVLYGWLVGRAAADLGLAQAIAANEAQRVEQIRRLEEALMGQMRELQNSQSTAGASTDSTEVERLKNQVQQFSEWQNFLEAQQLTSGQLEAQLAAKIHELESQIAQPAIAMADDEINALRAQMDGLAERITQAEAAAAREPVPADNRLAQEQIAAAVQEQGEALKLQLFEQLQRQTAVANEFKALESSLQNKIDGVQQEVREKAALLRLRDTELSDLRLQLAGLAQRLDQVAVTTPAEGLAAEREAERAQWQRDFDERLTTRLRELGDEIRGKLHGVTSVKVDQEQFRGETLALTARIVQLEQFSRDDNSGAATQAREAYQATLALRTEIAALKSAMLEQQHALPGEALVRSVEELRGHIHELGNRFAQNQHDGHESANHFKELRDDIQTLMQRQAQAETLAQQAQASVTQESAQIRAALKAELVAIEAQLNERRSRDAALQVMEESLDLRLRELHHQMAQGMLALDQREGEFRDLKTQVQILAQRVGQNSVVAPVVSLSRPDPAVAAPFGGFPPSLQPAELPVSAGSLERASNLLQPAVPGNGGAADSGKISAVDLHDRLSAEIERKRAELREKSGRWKVRH